MAYARWYGLRVKPRHEKSASSILAEKGLDGYPALYTCKRNWSDRTVTVELPLFPGYIFCRFELQQRLAVQKTPGVMSILSLAGQPAPIPEDQVEAVQRVVHSGLAAQPWPDMHAGQVVYVMAGPLEGTRGVYIQSKNDGCLVVNIDLFQRSVAVSLDAGLVRPC